MILPDIAALCHLVMLEPVHECHHVLALVIKVAPTQIEWTSGYHPGHSVGCVFKCIYYISETRRFGKHCPSVGPTFRTYYMIAMD